MKMTRFLRPAQHPAFQVPLCFALVAVFAPGAHAQDGGPWFSFQSTFGHYLQAYTDGQMHASNDQRGNEETWIILKTDSNRGTYAIKNARTGRYLTYAEAGCFWANRERVGPWEQFFFEDAGNNWIRIRSARTDYRALLGANQAGADDKTCKGEVKGDQGSTEWRIKSHDTVEDSGGGVDVGKVVSTAAQIANLVKVVVALAQ